MTISMGGDHSVWAYLLLMVAINLLASVMSKETIRIRQYSSEFSQSYRFIRDSLPL